MTLLLIIQLQLHLLSQASFDQLGYLLASLQHLLLYITYSQVFQHAKEPLTILTCQQHLDALLLLFYLLLLQLFLLVQQLLQFQLESFLLGSQQLELHKLFLFQVQKLLLVQQLHLPYQQKHCQLLLDVVPPLVLIAHQRQFPILKLYRARHQLHQSDTYEQSIVVACYTSQMISYVNVSF